MAISLPLRRLAAALLLVFAGLSQAADPTVSNVRAVQKTGTKQVEIYYDLAGTRSPVFVSLQVSSDGGTSFAVPASTLSGHVGAGVALGKSKKITWNAGADWNNQLSNTVKFRVTARDTSEGSNYMDATGEIDPNVGNHPHLDITSVVVSSDGTDVTFRINLNGDPVAIDWGKYLIGIRSGVGGATAGNGWSRPINFAPGMIHWIGIYVDYGNGAQTWTYSSGSWTNQTNPTITKDNTGLTITETAANLGLVAGEKMIFDVYTSGGGGADSAVDALSAVGASITGWAGPYTTQLVTSETNAALEFTMPGTLTFANWITGFGLAVADQDPGDDPDGDGLTNQQEFDANPNLNPNSYDTDGDGKPEDEDVDSLAVEFHSTAGPECPTE